MPSGEGVWASLSEGPESFDDTLTESMLSPEFPAGGERGLSFTGEPTVPESAPRNSLSTEHMMHLTQKDV